MLKKLLSSLLLASLLLVGCDTLEMPGGGNKPGGNEPDPDANRPQLERVLGQYVGGDSRPGDAPGTARGDVAVRVFEHGEKWDDLRAEIYLAGPGVVMELECALGEKYELTCVHDAGPSDYHHSVESRYTGTVTPSGWSGEVWDRYWFKEEDDFREESHVLNFDYQRQPSDAVTLMGEFTGKYRDGAREQSAIVTVERKAGEYVGSIQLLDEKGELLGEEAWTCAAPLTNYLSCRAEIDRGAYGTDHWVFAGTLDADAWTGEYLFQESRGEGSWDFRGEFTFERNSTASE